MKLPISYIFGSLIVAMSRLTQVFADLQSDKRRALIPYVVAGDPSPEGTVSLLHSLVDAGASKALMVVALLRSHQSSTQRLSMQAVHNLMADDAVRMQVLDQGGVFGLLKLAGAHNPVTQRVCALTMYHLVHEYAPRQALVPLV